eukprot:TRINITY_DN3191_c0_g1_i1.p1 TRINITY_DN3191_c0_g1~~TRINITY_DN3191_c0_g1_i1.p1  ORF type:complete len:864 (+),score=202.79 TRINITY_DN3191_c0_g1_i1:171-2762(+)
MCIRDRYQRRVHGDRSMEEQDEGSTVRIASMAVTPQLFSIEKESLEDMVTAYLQRNPTKFDDLRLIDESRGLVGLEEVLRTDVQAGLPGLDSRERRAHFGSNMRAPPAVRGFWKILWDVLADPLLRILLIAGCVSIAIGLGFEEDKSIAWVDGAGILIAVVIVSLVSTMNDWEKERKFQELNKTADEDKMIKCLSKGATIVKHEGYIVVGDVMVIEGGKNLPADGILIHGQGVACDESGMTGESVDCNKDTLENCQKKLQDMLSSGKILDDHTIHQIPSPILLSGTQVKKGEGIFLVIAVGDSSCVGKILATLKEKPTVTPLQQKLGGIAEFIGKIGFYTAIVTVGVLVIRYLISRIAFGEWDSEDVALVFGFFILGITVLIVAIPEGLPLAVTIALAYSVGKMYEEQNLVKTLMSCEVMGNANYICSDKTGTLTKNEMEIVNLFFNQQKIHLDPEKKNEKLSDEMGEEAAAEFCRNLSCNTLENGANATELAFIKLLNRINYDTEGDRKKYFSKKYTRFFFDSARKKMSTIIEISPDHHRLYVKGAAEQIVDCCNTFHRRESAPETLSDEIYKEIDAKITEFNREALRTLAVAYRDLAPGEFGEEHDEQNENGQYIVEQEKLTFFCLAGIRDTLRSGVEEAVNKCRVAGVKVKMVTGDNKITAETIAQKCGILQESHEYSVMIGEDFNEKLGGLLKYCNECKKEITKKELDSHKEKIRMENLKKREEERLKAMEKKVGKKEEENGEEEEAELEKMDVQDECPFCKKKEVIDKVRNISAFREINPHLCVLARSRPLDKLLLVTALKELDQIVAVTGDGTNDAPALKKADVGFAMGKAGTDIAKNAADIILLDDNFTSIITAIK